MAELYDMLPIADRTEWVQSLNLPTVPPRTDKRGGVNPEHYRARLAILNMVSEAAVLRGEPLTKIDAVTKSLHTEISLSGLDPKSIADARSDGDKARDAAEAIIESPPELFARIDKELELLEKAIDDAVTMTRDIALERATESVKPYDKAANDAALAAQKEERQRRGKEWLNRLKRVRRLREMARDPLPRKGLRKGIDDHVWKASHVLRWMAYVSRSSTQEGRTTTGEVTKSDVMRFGRHHARFAIDVYEARYGIQYTNGYMQETSYTYKGIILIAPPGHGKTTFVSHYLGLDIFLNHKTQAMYIHAVDKEASKGMNYIARLFDRSDSSGRRARSLIHAPEVRKKNEKVFELNLPDRMRSGTITPAGVMSAVLSADTNMQVVDDVVPATDVTEHTTREERTRILAGTFTTRQRGKGAFRLVTGYIWHQDDALSSMLKRNVDAIKNGDRMYYVSIQKTGGPKTNPPFYPLWPEEYPAQELRRRFVEMNANAALWSANYEANPISDTERIIRKLRYYNPLSPEHQEFSASAVYHVSVDPTATNKESSDKAGMLYAAVGEVRIVLPNGEEMFQPRLRILDAIQIHANPWELATAIDVYAKSRPVYMIHIETRSNTHATADILLGRFGTQVNRLDPGIRSKEVRLKEVAAIIDNSSATLPAIVEFPRMEGNDESETQALCKQLLDFGFTEEDHLVDCLSQLLRHLLRSGELVTGYGGYVPPAPAQEEKGDPRVRKMLDKMLRPKPEGNPWQEENDWMSGRNQDRESMWN